MKTINDYMHRFSSFGLRDRINRMFNEKSGRCLMLACDHGYFQGAPHGFENLRQAIEPLLPYIDCITPTRGGLMDIGASGKPVILRATGGSSITRPDELDQEHITVGIDEIVGLNCIGYSAQVFIGFPNQRQSIQNLTDLIQKDAYGLIALGVNAVGTGKVYAGKDNGKDRYADFGKILEGKETSPESLKDAIRYLKHACRVIAENGATIVKTYYCDGFEEVVEASMAPIAMAGGKAQDTDEMLKTGEKAVKAGVVVFDWGRNVIQNEHPVAMAVSMAALLHNNFTDKEAYEVYKEIAEKPSKGYEIYEGLLK